jgi:fatty acid-binding protein 3
MKELGVGWALRMTAKGIKPRLIISETGNKWNLRTESVIKTVTYDFTPGVEFDETTADGRQVKVDDLFFVYLDYLLKFFIFFLVNY